MKWKQVLTACAAVVATGGASKADRIVYNDGGDLVIADADGRNPRYVVRNQSQIHDFSFGHDEKSVFFVRYDNSRVNLLLAFRYVSLCVRSGYVSCIAIDTCTNIHKDELFRR